MSFDQQNKITVVFRYDDYSSRSPTETEVAMLDALQERGLVCTFGVIPAITGVDEELFPQEPMPLTRDKADILKAAAAAGHLEVALHGYTHQTIVSKEEGGWSEFFGLGYERQVTKITAGKRLLEEMLGLPITTFIPPWNSYDLNTLRALEGLDFKVISAGRRGVISRPSQLAFLPWTCELWALPRAVRSARKYSHGYPVIVTMFHPADIEFCRESGRLGKRELELFDWAASQPDIQVCTVGETAEAYRGWTVRGHQEFSTFTIPSDQPAGKTLSALAEAMARGILLKRSLSDKLKHESSHTGSGQ